MTPRSDQPVRAFRLPNVPGFRRNLWLLLGACVLVFTSLGVQTLLLNLFLVTLGFRADYLGYFTFANTAGIGGAALLAGRSSHRLGARRTLVVAIIVFAGSSAAFVVVTQPIPLLAMAVVNGASLAHIFVPCATFVMDNAKPDERPTAYAGYFTAQSVAMVIGSLIGGVLPGAFVPNPDATPIGYGLTLLIGAAIAGLGAIPLALADDTVETGSAVFQSAATSALDQRRQARRDVLWLTATNGITAISLGFGVPFLNVFFSDKLGVSTADVGFIFALGSAAMVVASIGGPPVAARLGPIATIVLFRLATAPIFLGLAVTGAVPIAAGLYVGRIFLTNLTWPVDNAFSMELVPPTMRATLAGLRSASWNLCWAVSGAIAGQLIVLAGFPTIFAAAAVFVALGSGAYFWAFRGRAPAPSTGPAAPIDVAVAE
jgi:predicted MFS family arabinose efflux permease